MRGWIALFQIWASMVAQVTFQNKKKTKYIKKITLFEYYKLFEILPPPEATTVSF